MQNIERGFCVASTNLMSQNFHGKTDSAQQWRGMQTHGLFKKNHTEWKKPAPYDCVYMNYQQQAKQTDGDRHQNICCPWELGTDWKKPQGTFSVTMIFYLLTGA